MVATGDGRYTVTLPDGSIHEGVTERFAQQLLGEEVDSVGIIRDVVQKVGDFIPGNDIFDQAGAWYDELGNPIMNMGPTGVPPNTGQPVVINQGGGAPPAVIPPGAVGTGSCGGGPSPVLKKVCGVYKWVIPKRRRRRQLLTNRDYNDLLKLQTLKVNQNMTAAISKALTR